jgi:hypothetical protein
VVELPATLPVVEGDVVPLLVGAPPPLVSAPVLPWLPDVAPPELVAALAAPGEFFRSDCPQPTSSKSAHPPQRAHTAFLSPFSDARITHSIPSSARG